MMGNSEHTEEERKAAAEKVKSRMDLAAPYSDVGDLLMDAACDDDFGVASSLAIDLQIQLTRTEKRLEVAKSLLHDSLPLVQCVDGCECSADLLFKKIIAFLTPPAEGE